MVPVVPPVSVSGGNITRNGVFHCMRQSARLACTKWPSTHTAHGPPITRLPIKPSRPLEAMSREAANSGGIRNRNQARTLGASSGKSTLAASGALLGNVTVCHTARVKSGALPTNGVRWAWSKGNWPNGSSHSSAVWMGVTAFGGCGSSTATAMNSAKGRATSASAQLGNRGDLVAHLGGDDFAFVSTSARAEVIGMRVLENVDSLMPMASAHCPYEQPLLSKPINSRSRGLRAGGGWKSWSYTPRIRSPAVAVGIPVLAVNSARVYPAARYCSIV